MVCGHTHHQFELRAGEQRVVNAGSVGMPYEGRAGAFWLLVADGEPEPRRTEYDVERPRPPCAPAAFPTSTTSSARACSSRSRPPSSRGTSRTGRAPDSGPSLQ